MCTLAGMMALINYIYLSYGSIPKKKDDNDDEKPVSRKFPVLISPCHTKFSINKSSKQKIYVSRSLHIMYSKKNSLCED